MNLVGDGEGAAVQTMSPARRSLANPTDRRSGHRNGLPRVRRISMNCGVI